MTKSRIIIVTAALACGLGSASALAAAADDAIKSCRAAIEEAQGVDVSAKLSKVKPRGNNYEVWFNVKDDGIYRKSYCYLKRGEVRQLLTQEGRWKGRNPRRPEGVDLS